MKLELKNVKHSGWASRETHCYEAILYVDDKAFAYVGNDGQGGADRFDHDPRFKDISRWRTISKELEGFCAKKYQWEWEGKSFDGSIESACHELLTDHLIRKDFKKCLQKPCFVDGDKITYYKVSSKTPNVFNRIREQIKNPNLVFLNEMPEDVAFKKYKEVV